MSGNLAHQGIPEISRNMEGNCDGAKLILRLQCIMIDDELKTTGKADRYKS